MTQILHQPRAGRYLGQVQTWLDPTQEPAESSVDGTLSELFPGRWDFNYTWSFEGKPYAGRMTFGYDEAQSRYWAVWLDSFHTPTEPMLSVGEPGNDRLPISLLGHYTAGPQTWGWRTTFSGDVVEMANITPEGEECPAVKVALRPQ